MITGTSRFHARPGSPARRRPQTSKPEEDQVGALGLDERERLGGPVGGEDLEAVVGELTREVLPRWGLLLDQQHRFAHAADASNGPRARPDVLSDESVTSGSQASERDGYKPRASRS